MAWIERELGYDWEEVDGMNQGVWTQLGSAAARPVFWVCFDDSQEYSTFLEFIWRMGDRPIEIIDATDVNLTDHLGRPWTPKSLAIVSSDRLAESGLINQSRALSHEEIRSFRSGWARLRNENAALRVVRERNLVSAPITYFDDAIVEQAAEEWRRGASLVGETMGGLWQSPESPHVSDIFLWARVCALAEGGRLELRGDESEMRLTEVRRVTAFYRPPSEDPPRG